MPPLPAPLPSPNAVLRGRYGALLILPASTVPGGLWRFQVFSARGGARTSQPAANTILHGVARDPFSLAAIRRLYADKMGGLAGLEPEMMAARLRRDLDDGILFAAFYIPSWDSTGFVTTKKPDLSDLLEDPPGAPLTWSPAQRIAAMLRRVPGCMKPDLRDKAAQMLSPTAIAPAAAMTMGLAVAQGFGAGEAIDGILLAAAWMTAGWQGVLTLKDLIAAIIAAAGETSRPAIQEDAAQAAAALDVLGLTFLQAILLRAADQEKVISLEAEPAEELPVVTKTPEVVKGWRDYPSTAAPERMVAEEGAADTTPLFRAVTTPELDSIRSFNAFTNPPGIEVKYFSTTLEGAQSYASQAASAFGDGPFSIIRTSIPTSIITPEMSVTVDGGIPTIVVPTEELPSLSIPEILPIP